MFESDGLRVDLEHRQVFPEGQEVHLTPTEYKLLATLVRSSGKVLTHRKLLHEVWGANYEGQTHYLRVYLAQLRQKLERDSARPRVLLTEPGVGAPMCRPPVRRAAPVNLRAGLSAGIFHHHPPRAWQVTGWVPGTMGDSESDSRGDREITDLLIQLRDGRPEAMDRLFPLVYDQLRRIAHRQLQAERPEHTLGTTGLVHETYLKLVDQTLAQWRDRGHFFRVSSMAMRRILVDYARRYRALRRGGGLERVAFDQAAEAALAERGDRLLDLEEALSRLAAVDPRLAQVVECRYFGGLTDAETAEALGVSLRTVERDWAKARGWLALELGADAPG